MKGFHIVALNETKVDNTIADKLLEIEGYTLYREDRNRYGDRVAVHVAESLKHHRRNDPESRVTLMRNGAESRVTLMLMVTHN